MFGAGWVYPILVSIGLIVVCTAMELLSVGIIHKEATRQGVGQGFVRRRKAA